MSDSVRDLRSHIDAAHAAAEELVREAERRARDSAGDVPPRGWDVPPADDRPVMPELAVLVAVLEQVREAIPSELSAQLAQAVRDLLVAVRALLDWALERLEAQAGAARASAEARVQDIPID